MQKYDLRSDLLLGNVVFGRGIGRVVTLADAVDLVVGRRPVVIAVLTGTCHSPLHVRRMPGANAGHLAQTLVRLARQLLGAPAARDALEAVALGDRDTVDHLVLLEDGPNLDRFLEHGLGEVDLVRHAAAVDLNLHQMRLLLLQGRLADLRVGQDAHDGAVAFDAASGSALRWMRGAGGAVPLLWLSTVMEIGKGGVMGTYRSFCWRNIRDAEVSVV